jgi:hypothetical protein
MRGERGPDTTHEKERRENMKGKRMALYAYFLNQYITYRP